MRRKFFIQRVVSLWNSLPQKTVEAKTLNVFKELDIIVRAKGVKGLLELKLKEKLNKLEHSWTTVEDFDHTFWYVNHPIAVFAKHYWKEDWFFGNQFLNGFNPVLIEKCNKIPTNFHVTDDMRICLEAMQNTREWNIYIVNYEILDGIPANVIKHVQQYTAAPICLLYRNEQNHMIPIAIQ
eukprot:g35088.t1